MSIEQAAETTAINSQDQNLKKKDGRVLVKIIKPFKYNGEFVQEGQEVEMNEDRAVNHMRVGDVERQDDLINKVKQRRIDAAKAAQDDASRDW